MEDLVFFKLHFIDPAIEDFADNPTSIRHAFLACVTTCHAADYLAWPDKPSALRSKLRRECTAFKTVDEVGHAFKHVATSRRPNEGTQMKDVVVFDELSCEGLARDKAGKVTLTSNRGIDLLENVKAARDYLLKEGRKLENERMIREAKRNAPSVPQPRPRPDQE